MPRTLADLATEFREEGFYNSCGESLALDLAKAAFKEAAARLSLTYGLLTVAATGRETPLNADAFRVDAIYRADSAAPTDESKWVKLTLTTRDRLDGQDLPWRQWSPGVPQAAYIDVDGTGAAVVGLWPSPLAATTLKLTGAFFVEPTDQTQVPAVLLSKDLLLYHMALAYAVRQDRDRMGEWAEILRREWAKQEAHMDGRTPHGDGQRIENVLRSRRTRVI